ncbi:hypothetical protein LOC67_00480 [Stieleria sp. JC731]|uniref:hypothetical protein n=1 Tax=Pirellulaceae TaxID=2691357 RepID=UPI001E552638|nr:hypothetical protein [Stieleria sp. JC731]MCC9599016.1 hypothetical protein [Stieleria sp. JC731]
MVGQFWQIRFKNILVRASAIAAVGISPFVICHQLAAQNWHSSIEQAARQSIEQLSAERIADVAPTREAFLSAVQKLRAHLSSTTGEANAAAWLDYLRIEAAVQSIEIEADDREIAEHLDKVSRRATGVFPGLETAAIRDVRTAAHQYSDALRYRRKDVIAKALGRQLERFSDQWSEIPAEPTPDNIATLRLLLDLLERTDQSVELVDESQRLFSSPNVFVHVDEAMVQQAINRDVSQTTPVRDCILGTSIYGSATMNGQVTADLLPAEDSIRIQLALTGNVTTSNIGYNRGVRVRTSSNAQVYATRLLIADESGIQLGQVSTDASLHTNLNSIEHRLKLVRKIARKKAAEQKPIADRIAHRKLVRRISEEFAAETDQAATGPTPSFLDDFQTWLYRLDFEEPTRQIGSSTDAIFANSTVRKGNQLAAPSAPPAVNENSGVTIQIHESLIDNTLGSFLAGRTLSKAELDRMIERSDLPKQSTSSDDEPAEDFEIDFDRSRPVIFEARDGNLVVGIRGTRFAQGSRELTRPLEIVASYRPVPSDDGTVVLERNDEVQINFPGTKRLSATQAGLRNSIKKGFAEAFPQTLLHQAMKIPEDAKVETLAGKTFRAKQVESNDGWLTIGIGPSASDATMVSTSR